MKKFMFVSLVVLVSMSTVNADLMLLPEFERTFSSSDMTRGYWFEAPADFVITGLRVPDESGNGTQNVEVVRFADLPPMHPGFTNDFVSLSWCSWL